MTSRNFTLILLSLLFFTTGAQDSIPIKLLKNYKFRSIGPAGMSGRITAIQVDPRNKQKIYAGSASGGLWLSESGGISWKNIFSNEKVSSIGAVALDPQNPDIIWVGTGEGNPRNSLTSGEGIYKSVDGGRSWQLMGLEQTRNIHRIIVHPYRPNEVFAAAIGTPWGDSEHRGVYKSTDGGKSWEKILYVNPATGAAEMVMDPNNPDKLIVSMWEHRRKPWFFTSGGPGSGLYVSLDGGESWQQRTEKNGLPKGELGRLGLAIAPSDPKRVYALVEHKGNNALYRSDDGGFQFKTMTEAEEIGNRPFYYAEIYVDPQDKNRLYSLWSVLSMSEDGGKNWEVIAPYDDLHPDHHAFFIHPEEPEYIIEGNDGGLNISRDRGETWRFVENLPVAQFYHINYDHQTPYNIYGGMQDNGSWKGPAYVWRHGGIRNSYWEELYFGDGFDVVPVPGNPRYVYAMSQEGFVSRVDVETGRSNLIKPVHPEAEELRFHWNSAIAQDPFDTSTIYFGSQYVHKSTNKGDSWEIISPDLTTNDTAKQKYGESGGLTYDVTGAENYTTILAIEPDQHEKNVLWAGTDDGRLQITRDGGGNWTDVYTNIKNIPEGMWIPQVVASPHKAGAALVVMNDYRRNNWKPYVFYTENYGMSFRSLVNDNQVDGYCLSVVQDPEMPELLYLGTQRGLYFSWDMGGHWQKWEESFPTVPVTDLKIHPQEDDLIAGTFGRSAYILDDLAPLRMMVKNQHDKKLQLAPIENAYLAQYKRAAGSRFPADAVYAGENRDNGARIYFVSRYAEEDSLKQKKAQINIYDEEGKRVRKLFHEHKEGLNYLTWNLRTQTEKFPSRKDQIIDTAEYASLLALPGKYLVEIELAGEKDSASFRLLPDPRIDDSAKKLQEVHEYKQGLMNGLSQLKEAAAQLKRSKQSIDMMRKLMKSSGRDTLKAVTDSLEAMEKHITKLEDEIYGREVEGYYNQPTTLSHKFGLMNWYLSSSHTEIGEDREILIRQFQTAKREFLDKVNDFYSKQWPQFTQYLQAQEVGLFHDVKLFESDER